MHGYHLSGFIIDISLSYQHLLEYCRAHFNILVAKQSYERVKINHFHQRALATLDPIHNPFNEGLLYPIVSTPANVSCNLYQGFGDEILSG